MLLLPSMKSENSWENWDSSIGISLHMKGIFLIISDMSHPLRVSTLPEHVTLLGHFVSRMMLYQYYRSHK
jgi:hypothetical protein